MKRFFIELFKTTKIRKKIYILPVTFTVIMGLLNILYLDSIRRLVNSIVSSQYSLLLISIACILFANIANIVLQRIMRIYLSKVTANLSERMQIEFYQKLNRIPLHKLAQYRNADILTRNSQDLGAIIGFSIGSIISFFSNLINFVLIIVYISLNNALLLLVLFIIPALMLFSKHIGKKKSAVYEKRQETASELNVKAKDIFDYLNDIRAFGAQRFFFKKYEQIDDELIVLDKKGTLYDLLLWLSSVVGYQVIYILFYVGGGFLAYFGYLSFGVIVSLFVTIDPLIGYIQSIPDFLYSIRNVQVNLKRYNEILNIDDYKQIENITLTNYYTIQFINVQYSYDKDKLRNALDCVSLKFNSNEKIVILGRSGSGKSTLLKLLLGYDLNYTGSILVNNHKIEELGTEEIKKIISYLPQDFIFLNQTIKENIEIMLDKPYKTAEVEHYAKIAQIANDIANMQSAYETVIKEGGDNISSGQKQRLGILSALLKEKPFIILDECFSAIDPDMATQAIKDMVNQAQTGLIVVTHTNIEAISKLFDRVIIFDDGKIVAEGKYDEIKNTSIYQQLLCYEE